ISPPAPLRWSGAAAPACRSSPTPPASTACWPTSAPTPKPPFLSATATWTSPPATTPDCRRWAQSGASAAQTSCAPPARTRWCTSPGRSWTTSAAPTGCRPTKLLVERLMYFTVHSPLCPIARPNAFFNHRGNHFNRVLAFRFQPFFDNGHRSVYVVRNIILPIRVGNAEALQNRFNDIFLDISIFHIGLHFFGISERRPVQVFVFTDKPQVWI